MISISDFACPADCPFRNKSWPANRPKPTCRLIHEARSLTNPVTIASYRQIITARLNGRVAQPEECTHE